MIWTFFSDGEKSYKARKVVLGDMFKKLTEIKKIKIGQR